MKSECTNVQGAIHDVTRLNQLSMFYEMYCHRNHFMTYCHFCVEFCEKYQPNVMFRVRCFGVILTINGIPSFDFFWPCSRYRFRKYAIITMQSPVAISNKMVKDHCHLRFLRSSLSNNKCPFQNSFIIKCLLTKVSLWCHRWENENIMSLK